MLRTNLLLAAAVLPLAVCAYTVESPGGVTVVTTSVTSDGRPVYSVTHKGKTVVENAPLGLSTDIGDFTKGLSETGGESKDLRYSYSQDKVKRSFIDVSARRATVSYGGPDGRRMDVEWHVADNDVAFRYHLPKQQGKASAVVSAEATGFSFPEGTKVYMTHQSDPMIGWKRTKPSYEEYYIVDAPLGTPSQYGRGFTFPALFKTPDGIWTLLTETDVDGYYCASHLSDYDGKAYTIAYPMDEENNGNGKSAPGIAIPGKTPWRTLSFGDTPAPVVETTIMYDLVEPRYRVGRYARPGKGTWSWILWQDGSINYDDQVRFIDLAHELGYDNVLIDCYWDTNIGEERMKELIGYARSKGVKPILWFSSSGSWNDIEQSPVNRMDRPIVRKKTMRWLRDNGVDAIKVDFFGGDKQETMRLYEDILSDAADYGIDVIFHGCTMPRGWERMYPNYVGSEAVLASENMIFSQEFCDKEALHATLHPFIRNAGGIMEYGGTFLNKRMNKGNDGGNVRRTTDAFQLALAVLFQNPVQNFALAPNNLSDAPSEAIAFMKEVPTTWNDTRYIDGIPGKYAVVARRHGSDWYVAGVSNLDKPVKLDLDLSELSAAGAVATLISDGGTDEVTRTNLTLKNPAKTQVMLRPASGFVIKTHSK